MHVNENIEPDYGLLAKHFAKETDVAEIKSIEAWVSESAENKKSYDRMYYLWMQSSKNSYNRLVDVDSAWDKMKIKISQQGGDSEQHQVKTVSIYRKTIYRFLQLAAIVVIGLTIRQFVVMQNSNFGYTSYTAQYSAERVVLPDNSVVHLSKESKIFYPKQFASNKRQIKLEGEAFFSVSADKEKPFIIDAQFAQIKVVGTSFNVKAFNNKGVVEVYVESGMVELYSANTKNKHLVLRRGERGILKDTELEAVKSAQEEYLFSKKIIFKDTKLIDVAATLKQAYGVDIEFKNENVKRCLFSLVMYNIDIDSVMNALQAEHEELIITKVSDKRFTIESSQLHTK